MAHDFLCWWRAAARLRERVLEQDEKTQLLLGEKGQIGTKILSQAKTHSLTNWLWKENPISIVKLLLKKKKIPSQRYRIF